MKGQGVATDRECLFGCNHGADLLGDICVAETGRVDVEACIAWWACRTGVRVHGRRNGTVAVAAENAAEQRWEAAGSGGFLVVVVQISVGWRDV